MYTHLFYYFHIITNKNQNICISTSFINIYITVFSKHKFKDFRSILIFFIQPSQKKSWAAKEGEKEEKNDPTKEEGKEEKKA